MSYPFNVYQRLKSLEEAGWEIDGERDRIYLRAPKSIREEFGLSSHHLVNTDDMAEVIGFAEGFSWALQTARLSGKLK